MLPRLADPQLLCKDVRPGAPCRVRQQINVRIPPPAASQLLPYIANLPLHIANLLPPAASLPPPI